MLVEHASQCMPSTVKDCPNLFGALIARDTEEQSGNQQDLDP